MLASLASLIAIQTLDTAAEAARKRLAELPVAERQIGERLAAARGAIDACKAKILENQTARRALEKDIAVIDGRLEKFDSHKAAVKTNQEYTALLHEIATAKADKDGLEERLLGLMEDADALAADLKVAEQAFKTDEAAANEARAALSREHAALESEMARLAHERQQEARGVDAALLSKYDQLLRMRRGLAVARMDGEICAACHVRLRPHITQQVRRNDGIVQCDSCQRMLYFVPPATP